MAPTSQVRALNQQIAVLRDKQVRASQNGEQELANRFRNEIESLRQRISQITDEHTHR